MFIYLNQLLRQLCFFFDNIVYSLIWMVYRLILYLANLDLVSNNYVLQGLISRVYLILGIFMLFKLAFSFVQYIISPNSFSDDSKGFGKLLTNVMVSLALLVSVPFLFSELYKVQGLVLESNVLSKLILGISYSDFADDESATNSENKISQMATDLQFSVFSAFYTINTTDDAGIPACKPDENHPNSNVLGSTDMILKDSAGKNYTSTEDIVADSGTCFSQVYSGIIDEINRNGGKIKDYFITVDDQGVTHDDRTFAGLGNLLWWKKGGGDWDFVINYTPIISTICGGYILFLLLSFCIDIAARAFKLMFLEAVAPISIISYMDPKESMQNSKLRNWINETAKTFFSLFLRLAVVFLIITLVHMISNLLFGYSENKIGYYNNMEHNDFSIWIHLALILGIFTFAKQLPQMIEKLFNIKLTGELQLNPFKAFKENVGVMGLVGGAGVAGAALGAGAANTVTGLATGKGVLGSIGSGIGGMFGAGRRATVGAMHGEKFGKNVRNSFGTAMFAKQEREDLYRRVGANTFGKRMAFSRQKMAADAARHVGVMNAGQQQILDYDRIKQSMAIGKANETRDFAEYDDLMSKMDGLIKGRVLKQQMALDVAKASGDQNAVDNANKALEAARLKAYNELKNNDATFQLYKQNADRIQAAHSGVLASVENSKGLNLGSMWDAKKEKARIEYEYANGSDRIRKEYGIDGERGLEDWKNSLEWTANELANSSRGPKSPQPEGWTPHGEIEGSYGPNTRSNMGLGGYGPGPGGPRP